MEEIMHKHIKINQIHSGPRGWTKKLIQIHGEQAVYTYWRDHGNRKTAEHFGVSPWTISHCANKFGWTKPMENVPHILKGVARGNINPIDYRHLEFPEVYVYPVSATKAAIQREAYALLKKGTFIGWCMKNWGSTECARIFGWIRGDKKLDSTESYQDLVKAMKAHTTKLFDSLDFEMVDEAYKQYLKDTKRNQG